MLPINCYMLHVYRSTSKIDCRITRKYGTHVLMHARYIAPKIIE